MKRSVVFGILLIAFSALAISQPAKQIKAVVCVHNGWKDSILLSNGIVEAIIVPSIGRVMQFRYVGEEGVFWENSEVAGSPVNPDAKEWINFGGDKPWPASQSDWPKVTPRAWPPPVGFDASAWERKLLLMDTSQLFELNLPKTTLSVNKFVLLTSQVDPHYGIRVQRAIQIDLNAPIMRIRTTFTKISGAPVKSGVWVITQVKGDGVVFVPVSPNSLYENGYTKQSRELPEHFNVKNGLIELKRDPKKSTKIGNDAGSLLWIGENHMLKIDSPRVPNAEYPDNGSSAEVYTNLDPLKYIELEMLGPVREMKVGDVISRISVYTLMRRSGATPSDEARNIFSGNKPAH